MQLSLINQIKTDDRYLNYLRTHSEWYKYLNRTPDAFNYFMEEVKSFYKLRPVDKIGNLSERIDMINTFINILK